MYYSKVKDKKFSDNSIVGMRAKAVKELRNITKGGRIIGFYNHHVMIFDTPDFEERLNSVDPRIVLTFLAVHHVGDVGREIWDNGKEYLMWYPRKGKDKGKRIYIDEKGKVLRKE